LDQDLDQAGYGPAPGYGPGYGPDGYGSRPVYGQGGDSDPGPYGYRDGGGLWSGSGPARSIRSARLSRRWATPTRVSAGSQWLRAATRWLRLRTSAGIPWQRLSAATWLTTHAGYRGDYPFATWRWPRQARAGPVQVQVPVPRSPVPGPGPTAGYHPAGEERRWAGDPAARRPDFGPARSDDPWRVPVRGALPAGSTGSPAGCSAAPGLGGPAGWTPDGFGSPRYEGDVRPGEPAGRPATAGQQAPAPKPVGPPPALPAGPSAVGPVEGRTKHGRADRS